MPEERTEFDVTKFIVDPDGEAPVAFAATWWLFDEPEMENIHKVAGSIGTLKNYYSKFTIAPARVKGVEKIYPARFEFPSFNASFKHLDGKKQDNAIGFIDFLVGIPYGCIELMGILGELSSEPKSNPVLPGGHAIPPAPSHLFADFEKDKILYNHMYLPSKGTYLFASTLVGTNEPKKLHYWFRVNLTDKDYYPFPGEFVGLAVRIFPSIPWGAQDTSPFVYCGNWMDTVYMTSGIIISIVEPNNDRPYKQYNIARRGELILVNPSDFTDYEIGDNVVLLKDIPVVKQTITWQDVENIDSETWRILPVTPHYLKEE